ncbi:MAG: hypothetical protein WD061_02130 [Candidatus Saccharimonadales bacterium]
MSLFLNHHIANHRLHYSEVNELYISLSLRALAIGIGGLFVPLFLYDIGYDLALIAMFYLFAMSMRLPAELLTAYVIARIGVKHTLITSYVCLIGFFMTTFLMPVISWAWMLSALFLAFEMAFFWISYHLHISESRNKDKASTQVGITIILRRLFAAIGPLVGGVLAMQYGLEYNLVIAATLLLIAGYPLLKTPDIRQYLDIRPKDIKMPRFRREELAHAGQQFTNLVGVYLWPLWLLFILGQYDQIGFVIAISIALGIGLTYWVGKLGDRGYNDKLLEIGVSLKVLAHGVRVFSYSFPIALLANVINDLSDNFATGPFTEKFYESADTEDRFIYILQMNITGVFAKIAFWVFVLVATLFFDEIAALQTMFVIAALFAPAMLWVSAKSSSRLIKS